MNSKTAFLHSRLLLDTCCVITLFASDRILDVLRTLPFPVSIAEYVYTEVVRADLQPCIDQGLLVVEPMIGDEYDLYVQLSIETGLGDGELATAAIASNRNWGIGIDENRARKEFSRRYPHLQMLTTPHLMKLWADSTNPTRTELQSALQRIEDHGSYRPNCEHPLSTWWGRGRHI